MESVPMEQSASADLDIDGTTELVVSSWGTSKQNGENCNGMMRSTITPYTTDNSLSSSSSHSEGQLILQQQLQNVHSAVQVLDYSDSLLSSNELSSSSPLTWVMNNGRIQHSITDVTTPTVNTSIDDNINNNRMECVDEEVELNVTGTVIEP
jgi:hypothetical protein